MTHTKAVLYARFSSQPQDSIDKKDCAWQFDECRRFCRKRGLIVTGVYEDHGKGRATLYDERPGLFAAVEATDSDTCLVAFRQDRIGSGTAYLLIKRDVESAGGQILVADGSTNETGETSDFIRGILALVDEHIRAAGAARTSASMKAMQSAGKRMGGRGKEPWGWMTDPDDETMIVPCQREQEIIQIILDLRRGGLSQRQTAAKLAEDGHKSRSGGLITHSTVGRVLRNASS